MKETNQPSQLKTNHSLLKMISFTPLNDKMTVCSLLVYIVLVFTGPDPVFVYVGRQKVYVYPPDEYIGAVIPTEPPDDNLTLEWV